MTTLKAKIEAKNKTVLFILEHAPKLLEYGRAFVGKQIIRATDNSFLKKFEIKSLLSETSTQLHWYFQISNYSVSLVVRCYEMDDKQCSQSMETTVYLFELSGGNLEKLYDFNPESFRTFNVQEILDARKKLEQAEKAVSEALSAVGDFGKYDY